MKKQVVFFILVLFHYSLPAQEKNELTISGVEVSPQVIAPPHHKMVLVTMNYEVVSTCNQQKKLSPIITVSSNEAVSGTSDNDASPDWNVIDDHHIWVRAERIANGNGRVYTINVSFTDECGNSSSKSVNIYVPNNGNLVIRTGSDNEELRPVEYDGLIPKATPNPSRGAFNLQVLSDNTDDVINVIVFDMNGQRKESKPMRPGTVLRFGQTYSPGIYLINIIQGGRKVELKLIKLSE